MLVLDAPILHYRRPLKIRDFVWEIKYWGLRLLKKMLNLNFCSRRRTKKTYLRCIPLCFGVCLLFHWIFRLNCRTTVTFFIRCRLLRYCIFSSYKVSYLQWFPVMWYQCVHYKGQASPMACKLLYTLFSCGEFGLPVVAFDGVEYLCDDAFFVSL